MLLVSRQAEEELRRAAAAVARPSRLPPGRRPSPMVRPRPELTKRALEPRSTAEAGH